MQLTAVDTSSATVKASCRNCFYLSVATSAIGATAAVMAMEDSRGGIR